MLGVYDIPPTFGRTPGNTGNVTYNLAVGRLESVLQTLVHSQEAINALSQFIHHRADSPRTTGFLSTER